MAKMSSTEKDRIDRERALSIYKRNDLVQEARFSLSVQEQRIVLYAMSKIKPGDDCFERYEFDIKDFYMLCGIENESYNRLKKMLKALSDKSWWKKDKATGKQNIVRWFNDVEINEGSGKVVIEFHKNMMPYLLKLIEQNAFYTSYEFKYILPMTSRYSPRLYELLKSYQKNNVRWFFEIDELKGLLDAENYQRFPDFRRFALDPAVEEVNKYTDMNITYSVEKTGRKVTKIHFAMFDKTFGEQIELGRTLESEFGDQVQMDFEVPLRSAVAEHRMAVEEEAAKQAALQQRLDEIYGGKR